MVVRKFRGAAPGLERVKSSNVAYIGYDPYQADLYVMFKNKKDARLRGPLYRYRKVPMAVWYKFQRAHSKGTFVWTHLRGKYEYQKWMGFKWRRGTVLQKEAKSRRERKKKQAALRKKKRR